MAEEKESLMTLPEVAEYLQIKERTLYQWSQEGKIPAFKLGSMWRFKKEDLELWIEEKKKETSKPKRIKKGKKEKKKKG